ncbi:MAG: hypothetical protein KME60_02820 [Cyanomargarita calcarea GSE-NOS-MK-12-04C]|uniref:Uncharacterized protein n=1 Tax=Cyanomargarita calcarea GSE-NOS-MK-12-04C TaxID=2839659 RepID=A0A951UT06_9CYAN|nr:hypothetical protein [Cyanomargarita calcarea GSE-NOS-MK-12-04C]
MAGSGVERLVGYPNYANLDSLGLNEGRRKKEEGRRKKEVYICGFRPQLKTKDPENGRGINKNSEDK